MQFGHTILCVPDVSATLKPYEAAFGLTTRTRPVGVMPWGQTIAYVADINGFLVELCTPVGWATPKGRPRIGDDGTS